VVDLHLESGQRVHQGDGDVGVQVVAPSLKLGVRIGPDPERSKKNQDPFRFRLEPVQRSRVTTPAL
jgi:hypothetical protein